MTGFCFVLFVQVTNWAESPQMWWSPRQTQLIQLAITAFVGGPVFWVPLCLSGILLFFIFHWSRCMSFPSSLTSTLLFWRMKNIYFTLNFQKTFLFLPNMQLCSFSVQTLVFSILSIISLVIWSTKWLHMSDSLLTDWLHNHHKTMVVQLFWQLILTTWWVQIESKV